MKIRTAVVPAGISHRYSGPPGLSLAARITLLLLGVIAVTAAGLAWFGQQIVLDKFAETELQLVIQNRSILNHAIASEQEHLQAIATDWGQWDDLYEFVQGRNPEFRSTELGNVVLDRLDLDVILIIDSKGRLFYGDHRATQAGATPPARTAAASELALLLGGTAEPGDVSHPPRVSLLPVAGSSLTIAGLLDTSQGPLTVAQRAISRTDGSGGAAGTLVMGRYLHPRRLFTELSVLPSTVIAHGSGRENMSAEMHRLAKALVLTADGSHLVTRRDDMSDFKLFRDLAGKPAFMLETQMPRSIVATGRATTRLLLVGLLVAVAVTILILVGLIRRIVSAPLGRLTSHMLALREGGELRPTPGQERTDEIGTLARQFEELVSARHADQARLERLAAAVEHAGDAIAILDADCRIVYVNPQYEHQTGFTLEDVVGKAPASGKHPGATYEELWTTVKAGRTWTGRINTELNDGRVITEDAVVSPVVAEGAAPSSYVIVLHDVTERIRLEEQLAQAQKLEAVGQLAAGVAHEINTPTQYVGGNIRFLRDAFTSVTVLLGEITRLVRGAHDGSVRVTDLARVLSAADADYLQAEVPVAIRQSLEGVERVGEIVKSMRELAHPARDLTLTDLNRVVESAVRVAGSEWQGVAEISIDLDRDLPHVPCLPGGINQVIVSILVNAAHAIEASSAHRASQPGRIVVATRTLDDAVEIRISDNGTGMTEDVRARVFDPFFTTKPVGRGTGQGLAIAHSVVKKHEGSITVDSEPGRGTTFTVRLPRASAQHGEMVEASVAAA